MKTSKRVSRRKPSPSVVLRRKRGSSPLSAEDRRIREMWEEGVGKLQSWLPPKGGAVSPNNALESVIKRGIYRLVNEINIKSQARSFERVLEAEIEGAFTSRFSENPYYWALRALSDGGEVEVKKSVISRYAQQLLYASKHNVPADLVIGFIYQVGGIQRIRTKLRKGELEDWYRSDLGWLK